MSPWSVERVTRIVFWIFTLFSMLNASSRQDKGLALTRKRIMSELRELALQQLLLDVPFNNTKEECGVRLSPLASNLLEWHFSFTGVQDSAYDGGIYHGRILLHKEYPRKAPSISMMTPTGRWEVGKEICLSASSYHQETWDVNWNLRTLVMSLRGFILSQPREIGGILTTSDHQRSLAASSKDWACPVCFVNHRQLLPTSMDRESTLDQSFLPPLPRGRLITAAHLQSNGLIPTKVEEEEVGEGAGHTPKSESEAAPSISSRRAETAVSKAPSRLRRRRPQPKGLRGLASVLTRVPTSALLLLLFLARTLLGLITA